MQLDESVELCCEDLPQAREDPGYKQRNLLLTYSACGYKCPVRGCHHTVSPRAGMNNEQLEWTGKTISSAFPWNLRRLRN